MVMATNIVVTESNEAELESVGMVWGANGQMTPTSKIVNRSRR